MGYIHRSIEKMCERLSYRQFIYVTSRMDYLSSHINNTACALLIEKGMQIEVPERAKVVRTILNELTRIASHELWIGAMAMDLGAFTPFLHMLRDRERIIDLFEMTCGARLLYNYMWVGGLSHDLPKGFVEATLNFLDYFEPKIDEFENLLGHNKIFVERTRLF